MEVTILTSDAILEEWIVDAPLDKLDLEKSARESSSLHAKYMRYFIYAHRAYNKALKRYKKIIDLRTQYIEGKLNNKDDLTALQWEPYLFESPTFKEYDRVIGRFPDVIEMTKTLGEAKLTLDTVVSILKEIANRNYLVRAAIDMRKFELGKS